MTRVAIFAVLAAAAIAAWYLRRALPWDDDRIGRGLRYWSREWAA